MKAHWNFLASVFALCVIAGFVLDLAYADPRLLELWEFRNNLFLRNRIGALSAVLSIASLVIYMTCIALFFRRSIWGSRLFLFQICLILVYELYFGPSVSSTWSSSLSVVAVYLGAFMSAILELDNKMSNTT